MTKLSQLVLFILFVAWISCQAKNEETFAPITNGVVPQTVDELWADFDPRAESLDTEILFEWEEDGVILQVLRYRIGLFKGQKAKIAAIYGYPKGAVNLPGLLQIHGGGQYADYRPVLTNAKRGYATLSISWAGRINAPDYKVTPDEVKLFWENDTANANYKLTTDWGALDAYHAPCRNAANNFASVEANSWTLDSIESPRNNSWFLASVAARRGLTFLEQQPQVNPDKLGVYGHSMGGKLTVLTAIDPRVKAAAPSCGGISNNDNENALYQKTIADNVYLQKINCPIIFLSPTNDFHGHLQDVPKAIDLIKTNDWRVVSSPHQSHQDHGNFEVTGLLWFDQYLKGEFTYPETPKTEMALKTQSGIPSFSVIPDSSKEILEVEIYYTQQADFVDDVPEREHRKSRFWHYSKPTRNDKVWTAELPLIDKESTLWAYANVRYKLDVPVTGAGYYYRIYTVDNFNLSTPIEIATSEQLQAAGTIVTEKPSLLIEGFEANWQKDWFAYKPEKWELATHKIYSRKWKAPENAMLEFSIRSVNPNALVVSSNSYATEIQLKGGNEWQKITVPAKSLKNALGEALTDWSLATELKFSANESFREKADGQNQDMELGTEWKGEKPEFRNLRWIKK
ncbi:dienelactone hydrolase family protein [Mangrovibacterium sp.]|uniref:dienelactone hydrolase family protein n=1 Tax=Mangrovibacterium sp. TaxID=1961364 RepID=UPI0035646204